MYDKLKALANFDASNMDELVALSTFAHGMKATFQGYEIQVPEWLDDKIKALDFEIRAKNREMLQADLRRAELEREGLATQAERRAASDRRIADIKRKLGLD